MIFPFGIDDPYSATDEEILAAARADGLTAEESRVLLTAIRGRLGDYID